MAFWKKFLVFVSALILIMVLLNWVVMPLYVKHNTLVKVPSVVGLSFADAKKKLDEGGLEGLQGDIRYDPEKPIGTVLDQNPPAEQMVKDGRRIYLIVSGGEQLYDVPNLVGRTEREAKFILGQRNLELQEVESRASAQYPSGLVISQIEQAGSKVKKGTKIGVVISVGMETGDLKVPDLIGKNLEDAKKLILQNKLTIGKINFQPSTTVTLNAVIDQYPKANTMTKENQKIDLFVNKEIKKKTDVKDEELNSMDEIKGDDKTKDKDKDKKENLNKDEKKKDDKPKPSDKTDDKSKQPTDKKKPDVPKDKDKTKDNDGTKF
jgi:beta-lactam-binding protein with PASTA domain